MLAKLLRNSSVSDTFVPWETPGVNSPEELVECHSLSIG